jgi:hypothetical protein
VREFKLSGRFCARRARKSAPKQGRKRPKKCIIIHVLGSNSEKVHYNALFVVEVVVGEMGGDWGFGELSDDVVVLIYGW